MNNPTLKQCAVTTRKWQFATLVRWFFASMALFLLAVLSPVAHADAPQTMYQGTNQTTWYTTPQAACAAYNLNPPLTYSATYWNGPACLNSAGSAYANVGAATRCANGSAPDTTKPLSQQCQAIDNTCNGYDTPELYATNGYYALQNPVCTPTGGPLGEMSCSGTHQGKTSTVKLFCKNSGNVSEVPGIKPDPMPNPPPPVEVDYPDCPAGSYRFYDFDGSSMCSNPEPADKPDDPQDCASGNVGTVNGKLVCLPSNPAPATAKAAADSATAKADAAKAQPATESAKQAAKDAAAEAQRAKDASDSMPTNQQAKNDLQRAIDAAKRAAGYAGTQYNGPGGSGNGTGGIGGGGTGDEGGAKECGSPGKPKCQIDEAGTPDGSSAYNTAKQTVDDAFSNATSKLNDVTKPDGKDTSFGPAAVGWFQPGTCEAMQLGDMNGIPMVVDFCPQVAQAQSVMNFVWVVSTFFGILWLVYGAMKGS